MKTTDMVADIGTKALPENPFVRLRDIMNGYTLVKAAHPNKLISDLVYSGEEKGVPFSLKMVCCMIMGLTFESVTGVMDDEQTK